MLWMKAPRVRLVLILVGAAALGVVAFFVLRPQPSRFEIAKRLIRATLDGDVHTIYRHLRKDEITVGGLNEINLSAFLRDFVMHELADFAPSGPVTFDDFEGQLWVIASQPLKSADGREIELSISVADSDEGPKAVGYVREVFLTVVLAQWREGPPFPSGIQKLRFFATTTTALLERLQRTGVPGFAKTGQFEKLVLETWESYIAYNNFHAQRLADENR